MGGDGEERALVPLAPVIVVTPEMVADPGDIWIEVTYDGEYPLQKVVHGHIPQWQGAPNYDE